MSSAPYRRIADDLRKRIHSGALSPGDRAPSTRALAKKWKVANATAAHALQTLVHEGVLLAKPRSGMVVAGTAPAKPGELTRARVVAMAIELADSEGLAALSLRGLAARLGAPVMSLYRHVRNKDALLALMTDAALSEEKLPEVPPKGWRAQLELGCRLEWKVMRKHPWLARVMNITRPTALPSGLRYANWVMRALDASVLGAADKLQMHVLLHAFIQGMAVNLEAEAQALGETGLSEEDHMRSQEAKFASLVSTGRYPYFSKMLREVREEFVLDVDALFEQGLTALLDGLAPTIEGWSRG
jgi:DNA-binding transcriptional regulator YhcF (GntR family)